MKGTFYAKNFAWKHFHDWLASYGLWDVDCRSLRAAPDNSKNRKMTITGVHSRNAIVLWRSLETISFLRFCNNTRAFSFLFPQTTSRGTIRFHAGNAVAFSREIGLCELSGVSGFVIDSVKNKKSGSFFKFQNNSRAIWTLFNNRERRGLEKGNDTSPLSFSSYEPSSLQMRRDITNALWLWFMRVTSSDAAPHKAIFGEVSV